MSGSCKSSNDRIDAMNDENFNIMFSSTAQKSQFKQKQFQLLEGSNLSSEDESASLETTKTLYNQRLSQKREITSITGSTGYVFH